jgi:hypothetical protein
MDLRYALLQRQLTQARGGLKIDTQFKRYSTNSVELC